MKVLTKLVLLFGLLGASGAAYAEGGTCPPGYYPVNSPGVMGCAPIPGYDNGGGGGGGGYGGGGGPPPAQWESRWGAIVLGKPWALGAANNMRSKQAAEQAAMADCRAKKGIECKLRRSYFNSCGIVVVGSDPPGVSTGNADTVKDAAETGLKACRKAGAKDCYLLWSGCSTPVRIR